MCVTGTHNYMKNLSCNYIATYDAYKLFSKATCERPRPTHSGVATLGPTGALALPSASVAPPSRS